MQIRHSGTRMKNRRVASAQQRSRRMLSEFLFDSVFLMDFLSVEREQRLFDLG